MPLRKDNGYKTDPAPELNLDTSTLSTEGKQIASIVVTLMGYYEKVFKEKDANLVKLQTTVDLLQQRVSKWMSSSILLTHINIGDIL